MFKSLSYVSSIICILFILIYMIYNSFLNDVDTVHELTKWSWLVWTVYYGIMTIYKIVPIHLLVLFTLCVSSIGMIVMIGVSVLFFKEDSTIIKNGIAMVGVPIVYIVNFGQHFLPPILHAIYLLYFNREFKFFNLRTRNVNKISFYVAATVITSVYFYLYITVMDVKNIYGTYINVSLFTWCIPFISMMGIGVYEFLII